MNYTATVQTHPPPQAALTVYLTLNDDEGCGQHLLTSARTGIVGQIVAQIVEFALVVQILDLLVPQTGEEPWRSLLFWSSRSFSLFQRLMSWSVRLVFLCR